MNHKMLAGILLCPKSFQKQFCAFLKALEFQTICSRKNHATELRMFGRCLFVFNLDGLKLENEI